VVDEQLGDLVSPVTGVDLLTACPVPPLPALTELVVPSP
jgi:hypothetical protein